VPYPCIPTPPDYDAWREGEESVSVAAVFEVLKKNSENTTRAILGVIPKIAARDWTEEIKHVHEGRFIIGG